MRARTSVREHRPPYLAGRAGIEERVRTALSAVSFWTAITLPLVYVPLLTRGLESPDAVLVVLGLLGFHVLSLVGGRNYRPEGHDRRGPGT